MTVEFKNQTLELNKNNRYRLSIRQNCRDGETIYHWITAKGFEPDLDVIEEMLQLSQDCSYLDEVSESEMCGTSESYIVKLKEIQDDNEEVLLEVEITR